MLARNEGEGLDTAAGSAAAAAFVAGDDQEIDERDEEIEYLLETVHND